MTAEFNLSEKRKELIWKIKQDCWADFEMVYKAIEEQEKEFIRLLKESYYSGLNKKELFAKIDKLAGKSLIGERK